jgi:hypothetical protein
MRAKLVNESINNELIISLIQIGKIVEMANIWPDLSKIDNVVIYVGPPDPRHGHRVKVSNIPNTFNKNDCFIIKLSNLEEMYMKKKSFIDSKLLNKIKEFVQLYRDDFIDYANFEITQDELVEYIKTNKPKNVRLNEINESNKIFEYNSRMSYEELSDMASISDKKTGIKDVVVWIGPNPNNIRNIRVKISNLPRRPDGKNCFEITLPSMKVIGNVNKNFITNEKMEDIFNFIKLNMNIIVEYSTTPYMSSSKLIDNLISI